MNTTNNLTPETRVEDIRRAYDLYLRSGHERYELNGVSLDSMGYLLPQRLEAKIPTGFGMYGYTVKNGSFTIVPEEAEVVRRIFRMYLDGMGSVRIMKALIAKNIPAPEGGLWNASVIMMMLRNEKYVGDLLLQKFFTNNHIEKKQCFNRGELPQYFVAEDHEPIIDRETFDAVQVEIARRAALYTVTGRKVAEDAEDDMAGLILVMELNNRIQCGICGKKYRRKIARLGTPYAAPIWICGTYSYRGRAYCASKQIPEKILIDLLMEVLENDHSANEIDHIEMHPNNRVLFVFTDGRTEEHFWKDHSRRDSWNADKRKKAAEKTKQQHLERKERTVR